MPPCPSCQQPASKRNGRDRRGRQKYACRACRPPAQLEPEERAALDQVLAEDLVVARGYGLLQQFRRIMAERSVPALDDWLKVAEASQLAPFVSLATGLRNDRAAVEAALKLKWSNGPTEGTVTRIKLVKRQGFGRAKLDLLRSRLIAR
jgi:transposase